MRFNDTTKVLDRLFLSLSQATKKTRRLSRIVDPSVIAAAVLNPPFPCLRDLFPLVVLFAWVSCSTFMQYAHYEPMESENWM